MIVLSSIMGLACPMSTCCLIWVMTSACCRYGFVKFMAKEGANKAMAELHQTEMDAFPNMKVRSNIQLGIWCAAKLTTLIISHIGAA